MAGMVSKFSTIAFAGKTGTVAGPPEEMGTGTGMGAGAGAGAGETETGAAGATESEKSGPGEAGPEAEAGDAGPEAEAELRSEVRRRLI